MKTTSAAVLAFWSAVEKCGDACIEWPGFRNRHGYGECRDQRFPTHLAHRISYLRFVGPLKIGQVIDHLCRNPACCNPKHLEAVTQKINVARGKSGPRSQCPYGHPYSGSNIGRSVRGGRICKACKSAYDRQRYLIKSSP